MHQQLVLNGKAFYSKVKFSIHVMMTPAFILVRPQLAENIGTSLRALWNCGYTDLRLVNPKESWPTEKGIKAAAGAADQASEVRTFSSLEEAVKECTFVVALTVRTRDMIKPVVNLEGLQCLMAEKAARETFNGCDVRAEKVGILFGPERTGLSSDEVSWAQTIVTIDLNPHYGSLNLAQAVLLVAYHLRAILKKPFKNKELEAKTHDILMATQEDVHAFLNHLEEVLDLSGFFYPKVMRPKMARNIRNAFTRHTLTDQEVRTFRGIVRHFQNILEGRYTPSR